MEALTSSPNSCDVLVDSARLLRISHYPSPSLAPSEVLNQSISGPCANVNPQEGIVFDSVSVNLYVVCRPSDGRCKARRDSQNIG